MMGEFLDNLKTRIKDLLPYQVSQLLSSKKSVINLLILGILILGIPLGINLLKYQQIIKSRAEISPIVFKGNNVGQLTGQWVVLDRTKPISLELTSPFGPTPAPTPGPGFGNFRVTPANTDGSGPYTFTWDKDPANTVGYILRFNKDPQSDWTGPNDFTVEVNSSTASYTAGSSPVTSACYWKTSHDDQYCTNCAGQQSTCKTATLSSGVFTGLSCDNSYYNVSIENSRDKSRLSLDHNIRCTAFPASAAASHQCTGNGQLTFSWDAVSGAGSYIIRMDNDSANSPSWMDEGDMTINLSLGRACSNGKCQFTTGSNSYGDVYTNVVVGRVSTNGPANLSPNAPYHWSVQPIAPGEPYPWQGASQGEEKVTCS